MKKRIRSFSVALLFMMVATLPFGAQATTFGYNRVYQKPALTIILLNASPDVELKLTMIPFSKIPFIHLPEKNHRLWETYFRVYRPAVQGMQIWKNNAYDFEGATISVTDRGKTHVIPVPYEQLSEKATDDYIIVDLKDDSVLAGLPFARRLAYYSLHLAVYMIIAGLLFWLLKGRSRRSWRALLLYTFISKGLVCYYFRDWLNTAPTNALLFAAVAIFSIAFDMGALLLLTEEDKDRIGKFSTFFNLAGNLAVYFLMTKLPT